MQAKSLSGTNYWNEVATLTRLLFIVGHQSRQPYHAMHYVPELAFTVVIVAGIGETLIRRSLYGLVLNLLQTLLNYRSDEDGGNQLNALIEECQGPNVLKLFGLTRPTETSDYVSIEHKQEDRVLVSGMEKLTELLIKIMRVISGNQGAYLVRLYASIADR